jgi:hypothetical protein
VRRGSSDKLLGSKFRSILKLQELPIEGNRRVARKATVLTDDPQVSSLFLVCVILRSILGLLLLGQLRILIQGGSMETRVECRYLQSGGQTLVWRVVCNAR